MGDRMALVQVYEKMADAFLDNGLSLKHLEEIMQYYSGLDDGDDDSGGRPRPLPYCSMPQPIPKASVRLLYLPLVEYPSLLESAKQVTEEVESKLPKGTQVFLPNIEKLHVTQFHTSRPEDTRPDALDPCGGCDISIPYNERPAPTEEYLHLEVEAIENVIAKQRAPEIVIEKILMADSGTLLITWTDPSSDVSALRSNLRQTFPGAPSRQAQIIHTSLCRVLTPVQLDIDTREAIAEICERWTNMLKETIIKPSKACFVYEEEFANCSGPTLTFQFAKQ